ncbi:GSCOCG00011449001-RA-CDS [Cotesia congregata]|nr:GSCOCG00011449001-RA-CDS [Cotesia congregata]
MRVLGVGREGINIFCSLMDICQGISIGTYYACIENIYLATSAVYNLVISKAVNEEKDLISACNPNANPTEFTVSGDGTWKKRGFNSLFGVTTLVAKNCKKVVDTVVKSSFCQGCNIWKNKKNSDISAYHDWYEDHQEVCTINHKGSAGKMEVDAVVEMFGRSVEKHGVKYVKYIGDGDAKTFKGILDIDPYDGDPLVEKKECVGHVQKRMAIYENLSSEELLTRCLGSETQNNNESLNSLIWTFAPKHIHSGPKIIEIATFLAVCIFNEGFIPILKMMTLMGMKIGPEAHSFAVRRDNARIERSEIRTSNASKEARTARLEERNAENSFFEVEKGLMYEAGMAD